MKKAIYFITCILTVSVLSGCTQVGKNENTKPQTNESIEAQNNDTERTTDNSNEMKEELSDMIEFGTYYEEESGTNLTPIRWKVLGENDGYVLLLSEKIIDAKPFHSTRTDTDWENSTIREWLNNDFYHMAFSESEQQSMKAGTELNDLVFLLSNQEIEQYLAAESSRTALPTPFAVKQGVYTNEAGESAWWLRSPVDDKTQTSYISSGGSFGNRAHYVDENIIGIRPAIWIERSYLSGGTINVKSIWGQYDNDPSSRQAVYYGDHITATGIVRYIGKDSHGTPSMELAETDNGTGYVLGVFGSYEEMDTVSVGDQVTIEGDFHILGSDNMVVIKNTKLQEVKK